MFHERLGGDVVVYGISMTYLVDPCVLYDVDNEGAENALSSFVDLEIVSHKLVDSLRAVLDKGSSIV